MAERRGVCITGLDIDIDLAVFCLEIFYVGQLFLENVLNYGRSEVGGIILSQALLSYREQGECRLVVDSNSFLFADGFSSHHQFRTSCLEPRLDLEFPSIHNLLRRREATQLGLGYRHFPEIQEVPEGGEPQNRDPFVF